MQTSPEGPFWLTWKVRELFQTCYCAKQLVLFCATACFVVQFVRSVAYATYKVSVVMLSVIGGDIREESSYKVTARPVAKAKCPRCRRYTSDSSSTPCPRCLKVMAGRGSTWRWNASAQAAPNHEYRGTRKLCLSPRSVYRSL